jgi:hypothetical protein
MEKLITICANKFLLLSRTTWKVAEEGDDDNYHKLLMASFNDERTNISLNN